jgi:uncharacterized protein (TIGR00255 family)
LRFILSLFEELRVLSMTGYGMGSAELGSCKLVIEVRSVNHRFLEVLVRLPDEIAEHAAVIDAIARKSSERGRIELYGRLENSPGGVLELQKDRAIAAYRALREIRDQLCPQEPVALSLLSAVPNLFVIRGGPTRDQIRQAVATATERACHHLREMRATEGEQLAVDLKKRVDLVRSYTEQLRELGPKAIEAIRRKILIRIKRLLVESEVTLNPGRIEQEVAMLADRADVSEELTRLASHCDQFEKMLGPLPTPTGRKLEFLLQEMGREVNTVGSKAPEIEITRIVLELKAELERLREQVQNVL